MPDPRLRSPRFDAVTLAWVGGIALAVIAYSVGPEHVVAVALDAFGRASLFVDQALHGLTAATITAVRAVAIGLFGTYVLLSVLALRRGAPAIGGLIVVGVLFVLLVWGAESYGPGANFRWMLALVLAGLAALHATRRLARV